MLGRRLNRAIVLPHHVGEGAAAGHHQQTMAAAQLDETRAQLRQARAAAQAAAHLDDGVDHEPRDLQARGQQASGGGGRESHALFPPDAAGGKHAETQATGDLSRQEGAHAGGATGASAGASQRDITCRSPSLTTCSWRSAR